MTKKYNYDHKVTVPNPELYEAQDGECSTCGKVRVFYKFRSRNKNKHTFICSIRQYELEKEKGVDRIHKRNYNAWKKEQSLSDEDKKNKKWKKIIYDVNRTTKLTIDDLSDKLKLQNHKCDICKIDLTTLEEWKKTLKKNWVIDHDHSCCNTKYEYNNNIKRKYCGNCNRGLLCHQCNTGIGLLQENVIVLNSAIKYINKWSSSQVGQGPELIIRLS